MILLISASWVGRITGVSHRHLVGVWTWDWAQGIRCSTIWAMPQPCLSAVRIVNAVSFPLGTALMPIHKFCIILCFHMLLIPLLWPMSKAGLYKFGYFPGSFCYWLLT
jgi:hypothetical protein